MSIETVKLWPLVANSIVVGGTAVVAAYGPMRGGFIQNPASPNDQGVSPQENLYVSIVGDAGLAENNTTVCLPPGYTFNITANFVGRVSVNAATAGHKFSGVIYQSTPDFVPSDAYPPSENTSLLAALPQYLYEQYNDDEDLLAFVDAFNALVQEYMDWFASVGLPVYTGLQAPLLDWSLEGLYGIIRPSLPFGVGKTLGPLNTLMLNEFVTLNDLILEGPANYYLTTDDVYKRVATWTLYKGDGNLFNIRWVKRRVERFLTGTNGGPGTTDQTYDVSVTFGPGGEININLQSTKRVATGGALLNVSPLNDFVLNDLQTTSISLPVSPLAPVFKAAVDSGALPFPFQLTPVVNLG